MTPGAYLRQCREAAGLTLEDVALRTETMPPVSARRRAEHIAAIEQDVVHLIYADALVLQAIYGFAWDDLSSCDAVPNLPDQPLILWPVA